MDEFDDVFDDVRQYFSVGAPVCRVCMGMHEKQARIRNAKAK